MSMSTHVYGFRPPDEEWKKKEKAFAACIEARIEPPKELWDFFGGEKPDEAGVKVNIEAAVEKHHNQYSGEGFQVDLQKLPKDLRYIRFVNSW